MTNYASRLEKLEQQADDSPLRVVFMQPGESEQDTLDRLSASADDPSAVRRAYAARRICFLSWADVGL
jgi:hypothetical protein